MMCVSLMSLEPVNLRLSILLVAYEVYAWHAMHVDRNFISLDILSILPH